MNYLQSGLQNQGYYTYAQYYGAYEGFPFPGGLKPINESVPEIAAYIKEVVQEQGQPGVASLVDKIASIAPPTHSTTFAGVYKLAYLFANSSPAAIDNILDAVGCARGLVTIIAFQEDELVTPPSTAFVKEDGVRNI
ncbi:uncharacterized protein N7459_001827 [Penicillium hispanicum]|uniref:uncharacterized protein n=1 Tax=Penicillium hispanicum TaxID=1080232 RepID=UPI00253F7DBC|nr:uncharacterized protein N7459_001827 [Penicillium hispanicum]KAJ5591458.1 hypothetical protein N7459_001827 [Penicillium hispanicum]